jgi:hypothetical protein
MNVDADAAHHSETRNLQGPVYQIAELLIQVADLLLM